MPGLLSPAGSSPGAPAPVGRGQGWRKMEVPTDRLRELHGQGASERAIATELGISKMLVGKTIKELGLEPHLKRPFKDIDWAEYTRMREARMPLDVIAKELGVSENTLRDAREREGRHIESWTRAERTILPDTTSPFRYSNYSILHEPQLEELLIELYKDKMPVKEITKQLNEEIGGTRRSGGLIDISKVKRKLNELRKDNKVGSRARPAGLTDADYAKVLDLLDSGWTFAEVAAEMGITRGVVAGTKARAVEKAQRDALPGSKKPPGEEP